MWQVVLRSVTLSWPFFCSVVFEQREIAIVAFLELFYCRDQTKGCSLN